MKKKYGFLLTCLAGFATTIYAHSRPLYPLPHEIMIAILIVFLFFSPQVLAAFFILKKEIKTNLGKYLTVYAVLLPISFITTLICRIRYYRYLSFLSDSWWSIAIPALLLQIIFWAILFRKNKRLILSLSILSASYNLIFLLLLEFLKLIIN